jgi:Glycosyl transferases group 1
VRILVCAAAAPAPPIKGSRLALRALLEELGRDHEIHVLAFRASGQQPPVDDRPPSLVELPPAGLVRRAGTHLGALARGRPCDVDRLAAAIRPTAHLAIVGREPPRRVLALAEREGVKVTGEVSDVRPWLTGSRVFVCPMTIGSGIKNKLLEAMASALPCVATPMALGGLTVRPDEELLVADRDEDLAREIVRVLDDDELAARLGEAARAYVLAHHTWKGAARAFERVYHEVCAVAA